MQINPKSKFIAILLLLVASSSQAFPPAPYYTLYGVVRDQVGQTVTAEGAQVIHNRSGTTFYTDKSIAAQGLFSLVVSMNNEFFYPIEVSGNLTAGKRGRESVARSDARRGVAVAVSGFFPGSPATQADG